MTQLSGLSAAIGEQPEAVVETRLTKAQQAVVHLTMGIQTAMLQELLFAGFEMFDRTRTEMHLFAEFASKIAGAHSVGNIKTMWEECSRHQLDFIRRDCERFFKHGDQMIETASRLFSNRALD
jgi:hypothetical protein